MSSPAIVFVSDLHFGLPRDAQEIERRNTFLRFLESLTGVRRLVIAGDLFQFWFDLGATLPRGYPYHTVRRDRRCVVNHGLWEGVPDHDAVTQLSLARHPTPHAFGDLTIPVGKFFPMCGMNLAFRPEIAPAMYFRIRLLVSFSSTRSSVLRPCGNVSRRSPR